MRIRKKSILLVPTLSIFLTTTTVNADISGTVYRDLAVGSLPNILNTYGVKDTNEPGIAGIKVTAFNAAGIATGTTTTGADGKWSIPGASADLRVEFSDIPSYFESSPVNTGSNTTVQFVQDGTTTVDLGLHDIDDFSNTTNPLYVNNLQVNGSGVGSAVLSLNTTLYNATGLNAAFTNYGGSTGTGPIPQDTITVDQMGSVWGKAYQKDKKRLFVSTVLQRHIGFANSPADIYVVDYTSGIPASLTGHFSLQGVSPANGGAILDFGTVDRASDEDHTLSPDQTVPNRDIDAFEKVGKIAYGDIDFDQTSNTLWLVNLNQRAIVSVNAKGDFASLAGATTHQYIVDSLPNAPACPSGVLRPWALKIHQGKGYLGVVCDASTSQKKVDLQAYVLSFDTKNPATGFTQQLSVSLNYSRPTEYYDDIAWNPWKDDPNQAVRFGGWSVYPQPILSDIEFDELNNMYIAFIDRTGIQGGFQNLWPQPDNNTTNERVRSSGEIFRVCNKTGTFEVEGTGSCTATNFGTEFFNDRSGDNYTEGSTGTLALLKGSSEILFGVVDPNAVNADRVAGSDYWNTHGTNTLSTKDGSSVNWYTNAYADDLGYNGKANGMGDIELLTAAAPIEIGNRVWLDTDSDGIQDAGEAGIANVTVELVAVGGANDGQVIATANTDASGNYLFSNDPNGTNTASHLYNLINLNPASTYTLRIPNITGANKQAGLGNYNLTTANTNAGTDINDSDGVVARDNADAAVLATDIPFFGANNHNFDFGFTDKQTVRIGDRVWIEDDNDGDATTGTITPVVSVTVTASCAGTDYTGVTDNAGIYSIDVPKNTSCTVSVATPANTVPSAGSNDATAGENNKTHNGAGTTVDVATTDDLTLDFGFYKAQTVKIGDLVWIEDDNDGDATTGTITPVPNVVVTASCAGTDYTGTTDNAGKYFIDVPTNTSCTVSVATPANTAPSNGSNDATAGENNKTHNGAGTTVDVATTDDLTLDFGFYKAQTVKIGDRVWIEDDNDGDATSGSITPVVGVTVTASCAGTDYTGITDNAGLYSIDVPTNTSCTVSVATPANTVPSAGSNDNTAGENDKTHDGSGTTVNVATTDDLTLDFGFYKATTVKIGDRVWIEDDNDGDATTGAIIPVSGVTVTAACAGTDYTGITDNAGLYLIDVPVNTSCTVSVATPANTAPSAGSNDNTAGENDKTHDGSGTTVDVGTTDDLTLDFGFFKATKVKIGNRVWIEDDNDGDATTGNITPVIGTTVTAACAGTDYTGVTDSAGLYSIDVPVNSNCTVSVATPANTKPAAGSTDNTAGENDKTHDGAGTTVAVGTTDDLTLDFGFKSLVKIGNRVWIEDDNDGDATTGNITPIVGTTVTAACDGTNYTGVTDNTGNYEIVVPTNTSCTVSVATPANTQPAAGSEDNTAGENDKTHDGSGTTVAVGITDDMTLDFGFKSLVKIGNRVWIEDDNDGDATTGTISPVVGATVTAACAGTNYSGVTDNSGHYLIVVPTNTSCSLSVATPIDTVPSKGSDDNTAGENDKTHDGSATTVEVGIVDDLTIDFGFVPSVKIGNRIWIEDDNDGDATTGNIVVPPTGTVVIATASDGTQYKTTTDADGKYKINVPANDTYWVTVELAKAATAGSFDDEVADTSSENDRTHNGFGRGTKVLVGSEDNMTIDFGFTPEPLLVARPSYVLIGDRIWIEDDNDGDASTGKITKPAAGIVVTATSTNGTQYTGVTNTNGDYRIEVPENDTYVVTSAAPVGTCAALHCNDEGDTNVSDISTENNLTHDSVHGTTVTVGTEDNLTVDFGFCPVTVTTGVSRGGGSFSYAMLFVLGLLGLRRRMALKPVSDQQ